MTIILSHLLQLVLQEQNWIDRLSRLRLDHGNGDMSKCELCNEPNDGSDSNGCSYKYVEMVGGFYERCTET